jgi:hypothetical protein
MVLQARFIQPFEPAPVQRGEVSTFGIAPSLGVQRRQAADFFKQERFPGAGRPADNNQLANLNHLFKFSCF